MDELLTAKQEAFCQHFAVHRSGPSAYRAAYVGDENAQLKSWMASEASRLLADRKITARITQIQREATAQTAGVIDLARLQQIYTEVSLVDPNELTSLRVGCCRHCWGEGHAYQWREREYLAALEKAERDGGKLPEIAGGFGYQHFREPNEDCPECGGEGVERDVYKDTRYLSSGAKFLFQGVKRTKNGIEVLFADKTKCLETLGRIIGAFNDSVKVSLTGQVGLAAALAKVESGDAMDAAAAYADFLKNGESA
jgi:hypothetical protein